MTAAEAVSGERRRAHVLRSGQGAGTAARAVVRVACREWGLGGEIEDVAVQCVAELTANVHEHVRWSLAAGCAAWLYLGIYGDCLVVEVWDPDPRVPDFAMEADAEDARCGMPCSGSLRESGRGLHIVRALVRELHGSYGVEERAGGKCVFFGLPLPHGPGEPAVCTERAARGRE
jgi:anti-sigma regulatory factor (Ser/Thr protein kinase)